MSIKTKYALGIAASLLLIFALYRAYPLILFQILDWQKNFNLQISGALRNINESPYQAGTTLLIISFLYGVFHAVGPGHGKFILTSYLSLEQTKLPQTLKITWLSAIVQGLVAVTLVTVIVVIFTLSRHYFNLTLKWVERGSFTLMILFGLYWLVQALRSLIAKKTKIKPLVIHQIRPQQPIGFAVNHTPHIHSENCGCGHRHLPNAQEMEQIQDWKSMWIVVFSIGLRPCTGAILVLFLAYTLNLYLWGVAAALIMAVGTGLTLTIFASLVFFSRHKAIQASRWYFSMQTNKRLVLLLKLLFSFILIGFGFTLLHGSFIETSSLLFKR
ncbi:cobalt transporter [Vespertiliibacter pulmonis]|uniref:Nickel/cobalt efflux system n=1 Tax=Vespertiliibacter pulmonis TaxID=1443036 RepID=A0A3N4VYK3_9PAST|nr:nickel/cobalt transporter [Vespertiliibacter pulmonis]QLB20274.1 cobalt transporter [Vespertiliibacter pulmonis]RPE86255.1 ABC-type nickel/cobalt efflux system permease component RcnA [Vespertiliibacter pulmonis]